MSSDGNIIIDFPTSWDVGLPWRFELREAIGLHQLAILDVAYTDQGVPPDLTPASIQWKPDPGSDYRTFYGYVNHRESLVGQEGVAMERIYLIGTSRPLDSPDPKSWVNMTGSFVARSVAAKYGLRAVIHNSKTLMPFWTTSTNTDFQMLSELADHYGYFFWVDGATLYFLDPLVLLKSANLNEVTELRKDYTYADAVMDVHTVKGPLSGVANHAVVQTAYGIDQATGRFLKTSSANFANQSQLPLSPDTSIAPRSVNSMALALRSNEAAVSRSTWSTLEMTITGAEIGLGDLIDLEGAGITAPDRGIWLVDGATHVITAANDFDKTAVYQIELHARRNTQIDNTFRTTTRLTKAVKTVDAVLRKNSVWESSTLESVYV